MFKQDLNRFIFENLFKHHNKTFDIWNKFVVINLLLFMFWHFCYFLN